MTVRALRKRLATPDEPVITPLNQNPSTVYGRPITIHSPLPSIPISASTGAAWRSTATPPVMIRTTANSPQAYFASRSSDFPITDEEVESVVDGLYRDVGSQPFTPFHQNLRPASKCPPYTYMGRCMFLKELAKGACPSCSALTHTAASQSEPGASSRTTLDGIRSYGATSSTEENTVSPANEVACKVGDCIARMQPGRSFHRHLRNPLAPCGTHGMV